MKKTIIYLLFIVFMVTTLSAGTGYSLGHYVSVAHLHNIFEQVKRTTDVSQKALADTFAYYEKNRLKKRLSPKYIAIADYTKLAFNKRLYIINLYSGKVCRFLVAHGKNSGAVNGRVISAGNEKGSLKTPTGFFKIGTREGISRTKGYRYLTVDGLQKENRNARDREILLHTAPYVSKGGRSFGCFAIDPRDKEHVFSRLRNALLYSYVGI